MSQGGSSDLNNFRKRTKIVYTSATIIRKCTFVFVFSIFATGDYCTIRTN